jgi:glycosyltransferase involved in cell wall biosynthesis
LEGAVGSAWGAGQGATGLLVEPENPAALAGAITRLAADADLRRRLGRAGRERAAAQFTLDATVAAHAALYEQMAGGR